MLFICIMTFQIFNQIRSKSDTMLNALAKMLYKSSGNTSNPKLSSYC